MTNEQIIMEQSLALMREGKLKGTGITMAYKDDAGNVIECEVPEEIHTYNGWKERGYQVKKGEHSNIKFTIWKHTSRERKPEELTGNPIADAAIENMFMKMSSFFTMNQVELIN